MGLSTLEKLQKRGDMTEVYNILIYQSSEIHHCSSKPQLEQEALSVQEGSMINLGGRDNCRAPQVGRGLLHSASECGFPLGIWLAIVSSEVWTR